jgi:hypothetical protein
MRAAIQAIKSIRLKIKLTNEVDYMNREVLFHSLIR